MILFCRLCHLEKRLCEGPLRAQGIRQKIAQIPSGLYIIWKNTLLTQKFEIFTLTTKFGAKANLIEFKQVCSSIISLVQNYTLQYICSDAGVFEQFALAKQLRKYSNYIKEYWNTNDGQQCRQNGHIDVLLLTSCTRHWKLTTLDILETFLEYGRNPRG